MDKKIELEVFNISATRTQLGTFHMILKEVDGDRQFPVTIAPYEAQSIILSLQEIKTERPLTHDLLVSALSSLDTELLYVLIYKVEETILHAYIYLKKGKEIIPLDARTSDAVALAIRTHAPILIYESVFEQEHARIADEGIKVVDNIEIHIKRAGGREIALERAIENEDYELAASIRDFIKTSDEKKEKEE